MDDYLMWPCRCRASSLTLVLLSPPSWAWPSFTLASNLSDTSKEQLVATSVFLLSCQQQKFLHCPRQLVKLLLSVLHPSCHFMWKGNSAAAQAERKFLCLNTWEICQKDASDPFVSISGKERVQRCSVIVKKLKVFLYSCWVALGQPASLSLFWCLSHRKNNNILERLELEGTHKLLVSHRTTQKSNASWTPPGPVLCPLPLGVSSRAQAPFSKEPFPNPSPDAAPCRSLGPCRCHREQSSALPLRSLWGAAAAIRPPLSLPCSGLSTSRDLNCFLCILPSRTFATFITLFWMLSNSFMYFFLL